MRPGPPPKPPELKLLQGNPGHRPIKMSPRAPAGTDRPKWLSATARAEWNRIYPFLEKLGLVTEVDRAALASYCEAVSDLVWATREIRRAGYLTTGGKDTTVQHPAYLVKTKAMQKVREFTAEFGFTPSARARVHAPGAGDGDDDDEAFFGIPGPQPVPPPRPRKNPA